MFYQHHMTDTDCNFSMNLFCIFLLHNFDIHCFVNIYRWDTKWESNLHIYYLPHCMPNQNIPSLFFHLSMTNTYKHSGPMGMYMRYYTPRWTSCRNYSIDLSNNLHLCMQCYPREAKISRHCRALLIH